MTPRPDLLPEETPPPPPERRRITGVKTALWIVLLLFALSFVGFSSLVVNQPDLFGLIPIQDLAQTNVRIASTADALDLTNTFNIQREQALRGTQAALVNRENLVQGTETQQAVNANITLTALAISNAQQATQAALDFASTQVALQQTSTQVQRDFAATQTAVSGSFITAVPTAPPNLMVLGEGFTRGSEIAQWTNMPLTTAWGVSGNGALVAQVDQATLLTDSQDFGALYNLTVDFVPVPGVAQSYDVLLAVTEARAVVLRLNYSGSQLDTVGLYPFFGMVTQPGGATIDAQAAIAFNGDVAINTSQLTVTVGMTESLINVSINNQVVINTGTPKGAIAGSLGVQFPQGTQLFRFGVS